MHEEIVECLLGINTNHIMYTLTIALRKDKDLSRVGLEDKTYQIKSILNDLDQVTVLSSSFEHSYDEGDLEIFEFQLEFESDLQFKNHWQSSDSIGDDDSLEFKTNNLLVYFDEKGGVCHQISRIMLWPNSENTFEFNIYCDESELDIDFEVGYNLIENISFS